MNLCPDCESHHDSSREASILCLKYRNVFFTCELCGFITKGIANIDHHMGAVHSEYGEYGLSDQSEDEESLELLLENLTPQNHRDRLKEIQKRRFPLLAEFGLWQYVDILYKHYCQIVRTVPQGKKYAFTPLEQRLLSFRVKTDYLSSSLEIDEIQAFKEGWKESVNYVFEPFNFSKFSQYFQTYILCLSSLEEYWEAVQPSNIIYVPKDTTDPYSFYILEKQTEEFSFWQMDCRLERLTYDFIETISEYCITLFRRMYYDVFHHHHYKPGFKDKSQVLEYEGSQLLQHLTLLANFKACNLLLRKLVIQHSSHNFSANDKYNLSGDDKIQQRAFSQLKNETDHTYLRRLFDNLSDEDLTQIVL